MQIDQVTDAQEALALLTIVPTRTINRQTHKFWNESVMDRAASAEGVESPCLELVSHRHSQYLLDCYFAGDYKSSVAAIPRGNNTPLLKLGRQVVVHLLNAMLKLLHGGASTQASTFELGHTGQRPRDRAQGPWRAGQGAQAAAR